MKKIEQKIVRFYADNPEHVKAFDILKKVAAEKDSSIQEFVIAAINYYGNTKLKEDTQAETEENMEETLIGRVAERNKKFAEEALIERVAGAVEAAMEKKLPLMLSSYFQVAVAGQIEKALQGVNGFDVATGNVNGVPVAKSAVTTTNGTDGSESMLNIGRGDENVLEKDGVERDVVANDMLDLDSFFS